MQYLHPLNRGDRDLHPRALRARDFYHSGVVAVAAASCRESPKRAVVLIATAILSDTVVTVLPSAQTHTNGGAGAALVLPDVRAGCLEVSGQDAARTWVPVADASPDLAEAGIGEREGNGPESDFVVRRRVFCVDSRVAPRLSLVPGPRQFSQDRSVSGRIRE